VRKLLREYVPSAPGSNYLIQHSAAQASPTPSRGWRTAANLFTDDSQLIFDSVIHHHRPAGAR